MKQTIITLDLPSIPLDLPSFFELKKTLDRTNNSMTEHKKSRNGRNYALDPIKSLRIIG